MSWYMYIYIHTYRFKCFVHAYSVKQEIVNFNCRSLVAAVPFFTHADHNFVSDVVTKLQYEVFLPGDIIIRYGTVGTKMYFIQEGIVDIVGEDQRVVTSLSDGSYFGGNYGVWTPPTVATASRFWRTELDSGANCRT